MNKKEIFRRMCLIRYFELQVVEAYKMELIPATVYLAVGQEAVSATISTLTEGFSIFPQHRNHSVYLAHGGDPVQLIDELLGRKTGCCQGKGGSPGIQDLNVPIYGHHGLIGENIPLATGYALATARSTIAYFGDAASEEDYALTSYGFAATHRLPILYVCEDNDLSILTPVRVRRSWNVYDVTKAMGLESAVIEDEPREIFDTIKRMLNKLPAFINVRTTRHLWHNSIGMDSSPRRDRLAEMRKIIPTAVEIEDQMRNLTKNLWQKQLQKQ